MVSVTRTVPFSGSSRTCRAAQGAAVACVSQLGGHGDGPPVSGGLRVARLGGHGPRAQAAHGEHWPWAPCRVSGGTVPLLDSGPWAQTAPECYLGD